MGGDAIDAMHLTDVDGPQECLAILDQTFVNPGLLWTRSASSYLTFLLESADLRAAYEYHQRVLRLLQWGASPRRWALKWPCHLLAPRGDPQRLPRRVFRRDSSRSGAGLGFQLQPGAHAALERRSGRRPSSDRSRHARVGANARRSARGFRHGPGGGRTRTDGARRLLPTRRGSGGRHARRLRGHRDRVDRGRRRTHQVVADGEPPRQEGRSHATHWRSTASNATRSPTPSPPTPSASTSPASTARPRPRRR